MSATYEMFLPGEILLNSSGIIEIIKYNLRLSKFDVEHQDYVLVASNAVVQKFNDIIFTSQYDGRYHVVAQKIHQFKAVLMSEVKKLEHERKVAASIIASWIPICNILANSSRCDNTEFRFAIRYLQVELEVTSNEIAIGENYLSFF